MVEMNTRTGKGCVRTLKLKKRYEEKATIMSRTVTRPPQNGLWLPAAAKIRISLVKKARLLASPNYVK